MLGQSRLTHVLLIMGLSASAPRCFGATLHVRSCIGAIACMSVPQGAEGSDESLPSGVFFTQEDLARWRERAKNGPFKTAGDAFPNSPGDWERIRRNAETFVERDRHDMIYHGLQEPARKDWRQLFNSDRGWDDHKSAHLVEAAFVDLVQGTQQYKPYVKAIILAQIGEPGVDFSNREMFGNGHLSDQIWGLADWQAKFLNAYDYLGQDYFTEAEQRRIEDWLIAGAYWHKREMDINLKQLFENQRGIPLSQYQPKASYFHTNIQADGTVQYMYQGGKPMMWIHTPYNNRRAGQALFITKIGVLCDDNELKEAGATYVREYLAYHWFPDGSFSEFNRNENETPNGLNYGMNTLYQALEIATLLYHDGYTNLFDYTTQAGAAGSESPGLDKSLKWAVLEAKKYADGTYVRYADMDGSSGMTKPEYLISFCGYHSIHYFPPAVEANRYYHAPALREMYWDPALCGGIPTRYKTQGPFPFFSGMAGITPAFMFMYAE